MEASILATYLQRTLDLAALSIGKVFVGPFLGWVIVKNGLVIEEGEATTSFFSRSDDRDTIAQWQHCTLFLSINPLASPDALASFCAQRDINAYYVATDPESPVRSAALDLNRRYFTWLHEKRPYMILKWAETADGCIARPDYQPYWISNAHARKLVHQWRSQEAAIWVGKNTYYHDNPRLNVRDWEGPNPVRIVIDPKLQLSDQLHVFDQSQPTLCYNAVKSENHQNITFVRFPDSVFSWKDRVQATFDDLYHRNVQSVFVEGGKVLLSFLLEAGWWDEARAFQSPVTFEEGITAPNIDQNHYSQQRVSNNTLTIYRRITPLP